MPVVQMPDGTQVQFPDDMPKEEIQSMIATKFPDATPAPKPVAQPDETAVTPKQKKDSFITNFKRGVGRIVSGDVEAQEVADLTETFVRSAAAPVGGDYVAAGSNKIAKALTGQKVTGNELQEQRARRLGLAKKAKITAGAGEAASLVGAGATLVTRFPGLKVVAGGTKTGNAARVGTEAAIIGGVSELAKTGDAKKAAKTAAASAVIAPLAGKALSKGGEVALKTPAYLASVAGAPTQAAINAMASRMQMSPNALRGAIDNWVKNTGKAPTLSDVMNAQSIKKFIPISQNSTQAAEVFEDALEERVRTLPRTIGQMVLGKERTLAKSEVEDAANFALTRVMSNIGDTKLDYDEFAPILTQEGITRRLGPKINSYIAAAETRGYFTIREADALRQAYGKLGNSSALDNLEKETLKEARDAISAKTGELSDAYGAAMSAYTNQMRRVEGIKVGEAAKTTPVRDFEATQQRPATSGAAFQTADDATRAQLTQSRQQGIAEGRRSDIAERGAESSNSAVRVADELRQPGPTRRNQLALGDAEAERLRAGGDAVSDSLTNAKSLGPRRAEQGVFPSPEMKDAITAIPVLAGRASGGLMAHVISRGIGYLANLGVPPNASRRMAEMLTDPNPQNVQTVIDLMERSGVQKDAIAGVMSKIAADFTGAQLSTEDVDQAVADLVAVGYTEAEAREIAGLTNGTGQ